jgi:hypothetical protein
LATLSSVTTGEIADDTITNADLASSAAVATSKLSGPLTAVSGHGLGALASLSSIGTSEINDGSIADADISPSAAIATSKLSGAVTAIAGHGLGSLAALSAVGSAQITDGEIADADIAASAAIADTKLATITTAGKVANSATTAASANTAGAIVARDASGNFSAGTITANVLGNVSGSSASFSGSLSGDVTGNQGSTSVTRIQGVPVSSSAPTTTGQVLAWNGSTWSPGTVASGTFDWSLVTGTSVTASVGSAYVTNNASRVTVTLPSNCALGDMIRVVGKGAGGWALDASGATLSGPSGAALSLPFNSGFSGQTVDVVCIAPSSEWRLAYISGVFVPVLAAIAAQTAAIGSAYTYTLDATYSGGWTALTYSCSANCPAGLSVNTLTGVVSWTPTVGQAGDYSNVTFSVTDGVTSASRSTTFTVRHLSSCKAILAAIPAATDGAYSIDIDGAGAGAAISVYCDMTSDGGGWTLVYKNVGSTGLTTQNTALQGSVSCLANTTANCSAKLSDVEINTLAGTGFSNAIAYRLTSPNISQKYYAPNACVYQHQSNSDTTCKRYTATYTSSTSPTYSQCQYWGGERWRARLLVRLRRHLYLYQRRDHSPWLFRDGWHDDQYRW